MNKHKAIGRAILLGCIIAAVAYLVTLFGYQQLIQPWLNIGSSVEVRFWLIAATSVRSFCRHPFCRRMDRLDDGNDPSTKTNPRNHNPTKHRQQTKNHNIVIKTPNFRKYSYFSPPNSPMLPNTCQ